MPVNLHGDQLGASLKGVEAGKYFRTEGIAAKMKRRFYF
jgi:chorismate synthase